MAQPQILLLNDEAGYQRDVAKFADPTLTDDDILSVTLDSWEVEAQGVIKGIYDTFVAPFPIMASPFGYDSLYGSDIQPSDTMYPDMLICRPLFPFQSPASISMPTTVNFPSLTKQTTVLCGSGDDTGVIRWLRSNLIEFCANSYGEPQGQYPITAVTQSAAGVTRIASSNLTLQSFFFGGEIIYLPPTAVAGFQFNPSGFFRVRTIAGNNYIEITHNLGTGAFTTSSVPMEITWLSNTPTMVACNLNKIKRERTIANGECSWWEARFCARKTGTYGGVKNALHGYGHINVAAAIAYAGAIDADTLDTMNPIGTLSGSYNTTSKIFTFNLPIVMGAQNYYLVRDPGTPNAAILYSANIYAGGIAGGIGDTNACQPVDVPLGSTVDPDDPLHNKFILWCIQLNGSFTALVFLHRPVSLGSHTYAYYCTRDSQQTAFSNQLSSNITALPVPFDFRYPIGKAAYFFKQNGTIGVSAVTARLRNFINPHNDNQGIVQDFYTLANGMIMSETQIGVSPNHLLFKASGNRLINEGQFRDSELVTTAALPQDMVGLHFNGADMTDADITGRDVDGCQFNFCIWGTTFDTPAKFKTLMAGHYDPWTTMYNDELLANI